MHKTFLIPGIIIILLITAFYVSHQNNLDTQKSKNQKIKTLLEELEWKDRIIAELNQQILNTDNVRPDSDSNIPTPVKIKSSQDMAAGEINYTELANQARAYKKQVGNLTSQLDRQTSLLRSLSQLAPFSKINLIDDELEGYFARITEISQGNLYDTEYMMNPDQYGSIKFDTSDVIPQAAKGTFETGQSRLYAHFDIPDYPYQSVLIKWYKQGSPEPLEMGYFDINTNSGQNYAWIEPKSSWDEGKYFVEIYAASESPELLSAGSYVVE